MELGAVILGTFLFVFVLPLLFSAAKEGGHLKAPKFGRRKDKTFRQFPLHNDPEDVE